MKKHRSLSVPMMLTGILAVSCLVPAAVRAGEVLYDGSGFIEGTQSFVRPFDLSSAGTLTITLTNVAWPQQLSSLSLLVTSANSVMNPAMDTGMTALASNQGMTETAQFSINQSEDVFAHWFGTAQGPLNTGVYTVDVQFAPAGAPVPLPTSIALLLSGVVLLVWQRRTRVGETSPTVGGDLGEPRSA